MAKRPTRGRLFGETEPEKPTAADQASVGESSARRYPIAKTREGKRVVSAYVDEEAFIQLKMLAIRERKSVQALLVDGLNAVFEARGLNRIA